VRYGASAGFVCSGLKGVIANNLFKVEPKKTNLSKEFLYHYLRSPVFQNPIKKVIGGAAMPALSFSMISALPISYPCIQEQLKISSTIKTFFNNVNELEKIYAVKLEKLAELKKSILQKAFTGELTKSKGIAA
jgi:type I restriction enzyme S subunit